MLTRGQKAKNTRANSLPLSSVDNAGKRKHQAILVASKDSTAIGRPKKMVKGDNKDENPKGMELSKTQSQDSDVQPSGSGSTDVLSKVATKSAKEDVVSKAATESPKVNKVVTESPKVPKAATESPNKAATESPKGNKVATESPKKK